jgi:hypothetical protein
MLFVLIGIAVVTLLAALVARMTALIALQLLADIALGRYVYLLIQHKQRLQEQQAKIAFPRIGVPQAGAVLLHPLRAGVYGRARTGRASVPLRQTASN